jgi:hypothetical protein
MHENDEDDNDRVDSCCYGCLDARGCLAGHFACCWSESVQEAYDEERLTDNRYDGSSWTARIMAADAPDSVDLERLVSDVETEGGTIRGIDLGSIYGGPRGNDASDFRIGLESIALAAGWRERCHAMVSGGDWARRYYIAEPA